MHMRFRKLMTVSVAVFFITTSANIGIASTLPFVMDGTGLPTLADVVEKIEHGIVNISTVRRSGGAAGDYPMDALRKFFGGDDFFQRFFETPNHDERRRRRHLDLGSGVIINATRGHILTNHHLLSEDSEIQITLLDGRSATAEIVGTDPDMDLALLRVDLPNLVEIKLGDSDDLRVGDFVLALGNNYGLSATVTSGIVSALGRSGLGLDRYEEYIQTDAAINPGSSGGALVNLRGEVIGINTAILSPAGGNVGIAFAIPINSAASIAEQIAEFGRVRRGVLGIHFQELTQEVAEAFGLDHVEGVLVNRILPGSAAEEAGMREGDILTKVNSAGVVNGSQLRNMIALIRVGEQVNVEFKRQGQVMYGTGYIGDNNRRTVFGKEVTGRLDGVVFENIQGSQAGVLAASVERGSYAWRSGIREGDIVLEVNQESVSDVKDFDEIIRDPDDLILLKINRQNQTYFIAMH